MFGKLINFNLSRLNLPTLFTLSTVINLAKMSTATCPTTQPPATAKPLDATYSLSYVTIDNDEKASHLARLIVENSLAACVNIVPQLRSIYKWQGKIEDDREVLLMIKSKYSKVEELTKFIKQNHPYDVCEVITVPIVHGNPDYLRWIDEHVK